MRFDFNRFTAYAITIILIALIAFMFGCDNQDNDNRKAMIDNAKNDSESKPAGELPKRFPKNGVVDPDDILPYTEEELRELIANKELGKDNPERIIYWARYYHLVAIGFNKDMRSTGKRWSNVCAKYRNVIGQDRLWAVMFLADSDFRQLYPNLL